MDLSEVQLMCFKVGFCTETHVYYVMNERDDIKQVLTDFDKEHVNPDEVLELISNELLRVLDDRRHQI